MIRDPIGDLGGFAGPITNHVLSQSQFKIDDVSRRPAGGITPPLIPWIPRIPGKWGSNCSSDLPSTRVRVLHVTVVDVTNFLK